MEPELSGEIDGASCPNSKCDQFIDVKTNRKCPKCNSIITEEFINEFNEVMQFTEEHLHNMKHVTCMD